MLQQPCRVFQHLGGARPRATFFQMSVASRRRLGDAIFDGDRNVEQTFNAWAARHGQLLDGDANDVGQLRCCIALHVPTAVLISEGKWRSFCIPWTTGKHGGGAGFHLVRHIMLGDRPEVDDNEDDQNPAHVLSPDLLQGLINTMQLLVQNNPLQANDVTFYVDWAQRLRTDMVRHSHMRGEKAYRMEHLINCLMLAALGKDAHRLRDTVARALAASVIQDSVRQYYRNILDEPRRIPSATSIYRHRLTVHLGFCRLVAEHTEELLNGPGGACRWGTLDSSQQANHDLLYHGSVTMAAYDLSARFEDALEVIRMAALPPDQQDGSLQVRFGRLASALKLRAGVPVGVGSGKSSLRRKMHALVHGCRLTSSSWKGAARLITSTFAWTGDLGTESGIAQFAESMRTLFGEWVVQADAPPGASTGHE
ncbi:unnamed protein product [Prorocentrum cordatum]|uniref:Uncharacterized protein n=1 Tax=Prorocentrum cordatum TaxID=2364126 RepID=A0ABN9U9Y7_9DINO|nr:unnamed protein product [Polarella glacialis]